MHQSRIVVLLQRGNVSEQNSKHNLKFMGFWCKNFIVRLKNAAIPIGLIINMTTELQNCNSYYIFYNKYTELRPSSILGPNKTESLPPSYTESHSNLIIPGKYWSQIEKFLL